MQVIQIKTIEFEDLLDGVYKLEKRLDKIDEKLSGSRIKYVPLKEALKILNIQRKTADNWHKSCRLNFYLALFNKCVKDFFFLSY